MSSELTPELSLFKAVPGSGEPFRTTDLNDNADKLDAFASQVETNGWVTTDRLASASVITEKLAPNSVRDGIIADGGVVAGKIAANAVTSVQLANNSVTAEKIPDNVIDTARLVDNAVTNAKLADNAVNTAEIVDNAVTNAKLADNAVNTAEIATSAVTAGKLAATLDLTSKTITVPSRLAYLGPSADVASSQHVFWVVSKNNTDRNVPTWRYQGSVTATPSSGVITVDMTQYGFNSLGGTIFVTANIFQPGTTKFVVGIQSTSSSQVQFKVLTSTGANATVSTRVDWQAVQYGA